MKDLKDNCHLPTNYADAGAEKGDLAERYFEKN